MGGFEVAPRVTLDVTREDAFTILMALGLLQKQDMDVLQSL